MREMPITAKIKGGIVIYVTSHSQSMKAVEVGNVQWESPTYPLYTLPRSI